MELVLAIAVGVVFGAGIWLILRPRTFQLITGLLLMSYAVNLFIFAMGRLWVAQPPITPGPAIDPALFAAPALMDDLIGYCGGHPRELLRLLGLCCEVADDEVIDRAVLDASKALEAANASGDAQQIRSAMQALEAAMRSQETAAAAPASRARPW